MNTRDRIDEESRKDPERLEREIDAQRDNIGHIVSALESKLSPGELMDRFIGMSNGTGGEFARNFGSVVRANPVPTVLAATGLAWLYACRNETPATRQTAHMERTYDTTGASMAGSHVDDGSTDGVMHGMKERASHMREGMSQKWSSASSRVSGAAHGVGDMAHGMKDRMGSMAHGIGSGASHMAGSVRHQGQRMSSGYSNMLQENPMAAGAIAIAAGALIGALLPMTRQENRLMGETGDKLRHKASDMAHTARTKGGEMARELGQAAGGGQGSRGDSTRSEDGSNGSSYGASSATQRPVAPQASV